MSTIRGRLIGIGELKAALANAGAVCVSGEFQLRHPENGLFSFMGMGDEFIVDELLEMRTDAGWVPVLPVLGGHSVFIL
jgi:hypothetical protein